jgi:methionine synthase / methylenetetrahydrofolate reductase(NADPH)
MDKSSIKNILLDPNTNLIIDGAMGTMLHNLGVSFESCLDELNLTKPAEVAEIHRGFINAGAQIITTNTFGANRFKLSEHGLENQLEEINQAAVSLAKKVVEASFKEVYIAGDVGPLGVRLAPFGRVQLEQARQAFKEQINILAKSGVDLIIIETMSDVYEVREAVIAGREVCNLPILASMTFTRDDRTLLGDTPEKIAQSIFEVGANIIGINCSGGPAQLLRILKRMKRAIPNGIFSVMPNAGWPEESNGRILYPAGADYFGDYALAFRNEGASFIGGCCGTTPDHIHAMSQALASTPKADYKAEAFPNIVKAQDQIPVSEKKSALAERLKKGKFSIAVEMDPPRGLSTHKMLAGAGLLSDAGANVINVADSPMARMRMSPWAVCDLIQRNLPIETTLHFPTRGRNLLRIQGDLLAAHAIGIRNVFVVMGDPTEIGDYPEAMDNYDLVPSGLIKLIKEEFNSGIDHTGSKIGEPTNFFVGSALNLIPKNMEREIRVVRKKMAKGTDFFLTQPIYEPEKAKGFILSYQEKHGEFPNPIFVGVLPLFSYRHANFLHNEVPGINIPENIRKRIQDAGDQAHREGIKIAIEIIEEIKAWAQGIYLMPAFNRFEIAAEIIEAVKED